MRLQWRPYTSLVSLSYLAYARTYEDDTVLSYGRFSLTHYPPFRIVNPSQGAEDSKPPSDIGSYFWEGMLLEYKSSHSVRDGLCQRFLVSYLGLRRR